MDAGHLRVFANRDWRAIARAKREHQVRLFREQGPAAMVRIARELFAHARAVNPRLAFRARGRSRALCRAEAGAEQRQASMIIDLLRDLAAAMRDVGAGWYLFGAQAALLHGAARLTDERAADALLKCASYGSLAKRGKPFLVARGPC